jgi:hypothetical protein
MLSGERVRVANSFGVEASLPKHALPEAGIPRYASDGNRSTVEVQSVHFFISPSLD